MLKVVALVVLLCSFFSSASLITADEIFQSVEPLIFREPVIGSRVIFNADGSKTTSVLYYQYKDDDWKESVYQLPNNLDEIKKIVEAGNLLPAPVLNKINQYVVREYDCSTVRSCPSLLGQEDPRGICLRTIIAAQEKAEYNAKMKRS